MLKTPPPNEECEVQSETGGQTLIITGIEYLGPSCQCQGSTPRLSPGRCSELSEQLLTLPFLFLGIDTCEVKMCSSKIHEDTSSRMACACPINTRNQSRVELLSQMLPSREPQPGEQLATKIPRALVSYISSFCPGRDSLEPRFYKGFPRKLMQGCLSLGCSLGAFAVGAGQAVGAVIGRFA